MFISQSISIFYMLHNIILEPLERMIGKEDM